MITISALSISLCVTALFALVGCASAVFYYAGQSNAEEKLTKAMDLLKRAAEDMETTVPDENWCREYFLLTGEHMICTDEGWDPGSSKQSYIDNLEEGESIDDVIMDEVNAPAESEAARG